MILLKNREVLLSVVNSVRAHGVTSIRFDLRDVTGITQAPKCRDI